MHVLIIGAAGMIGQKLANSLAASGVSRSAPVTRLTLVDVFAPSAPKEFQGAVDCRTADLSARGEVQELVATRPDIIFHLAAIVSGQAETDMALGYRVNLDATRGLFEAIAIAHNQDGYTPRVVYTSSIGVFGRPLPDIISDSYIITPESSYGVQKAMCELMLSDYVRRGLFNGVGVRLPTICVRPGKPNRAASGFFSNIIREPLIGQEAVLPVPEDTQHWLLSPRAAISALKHAADLNYELIRPRPNFTLPALAVTVEEQIDALRRVAGADVVKLIKKEPDPFVQRFVSSWPKAFDTEIANKLGFKADKSFDEIIKIHIRDELDESIN